MSYKAYITTLKEINPHPNADKLNIITIKNITIKSKKPLDFISCI